MMNGKKMMQLTAIPFFLLSIAFIGCGSSGGGGATAAPSLEVLPADFDFGILTDANSAQPLEVIIRNSGTANLSVSDIALSDIVNFALDLNGGATPCVSAAPTIGAGGSCTVTVEFTPPAPPAFGTFSADLGIRSNDPTTPVFNLSLMGTLEDINEVNVKINQIEACPRSGATAYVSVTDQGGFPVTGMDKSNFLLSEDGGVADNPFTAGFVAQDDTASISVALLLDYSKSINLEPDNVTDMENAAISFVRELGENDEAEIIKFADYPKVFQQYTSVRSDLIDAIQRETNIGNGTALYDAIILAADNISTRTKTRRAIIIITDGQDRGINAGPGSVGDIDDAIDDANLTGVPVFTVGLGNADTTVLQQIANDTGGTYSDSTTSDNLATIYQQFANLLFTNQYILTYNSGIAADGATTGTLEVMATYGTLQPGNDTKTIPACP
jgi:Ca-activated chloride channel family protein